MLFFDEIEALAPKRGADSTGVTDRVVNQMLCYLDGVEERKQVFVIATTSRPDMVDGALMRPGRFDKILYCPIPDLEQKVDICVTLAEKNSIKTADGSPLEGEYRVEIFRKMLAESPPLLTGADLNAVFSSAKIEAVNEALDRATRGEKAEKLYITVKHLRKALEEIRPSISSADDLKYKKVFEKYLPKKQQRIDDPPARQEAGTKVVLA